MTAGAGRKPKVVIIIAKPRDLHALAVAAEVLAIDGCRAVILDSADYPTAWWINLSLQPSRRLSWSVEGEGWTVTSDQLAGLWWRRPRPHRIAQEVRDRRARAFCRNEARAGFYGWIHGLGAKVINPLAAEIAANRKAFQLAQAQNAGLRIPRTLITSSPDAARQFLQAMKGRVIFKVLTATSWQMTETRRFQNAHLDQMAEVRYAPIIFQEFVAAPRDIRATVVDDEIFAVSIRSEHEKAATDWRLDSAAEILPHRLPAIVRRQLLRLCRALGLRFGAVDLRLTADNEYVFLEVNPAGQFLFCEIHGGQPISRALAASLLHGGPLRS